MTAIRGEKNFVQLAKQTGVSRQLLMAVEAGGGTSLTSLRQIAKRCQVKDELWTELLVAWVAVELGQEDFAKLNERLSPKLEAKGKPEEMMLVGFKRLAASEKEAVLATLFSEPVRALLPGLVTMYFKSDKPQGAEFPKEYRKLAERYFGDKASK
jgi:transcriptional regulator with XRE-family HTH domain